MLKKNIIANYFGQFYSIIIGIVMVPFYLEYLGAEAYGLVGFFALMTSWMMLLDMGISPTLSREVAIVKTDKNKRESFKNMLHSLELIFMIVALTVFLGVFLLSSFISNQWLKIETLDLDTVSYCIVLMGAMIGLRFLSSLYRSGITGAEEQVWLNIANSIIMTFKFVGVIFVLEFISNEVKYFFEYQLIVGIGEFLIFFIKFYKVLDISKFKIYFSYNAVKPILPFALGIGYTGAIWIFLTQLDKLVLSGILPLKEYGYFVLIGLVANAILQVSAPISKAILPRMTSLLDQNKVDEMILVYKKSTQLVAIFVFSVVGIIGLYSYELLYSWTGNIEASKWGEDILFWYVMGNGVLAVAAFQYYLQFAYGKLDLHVKYNTFSAIVSIPLIIWSANVYGALGVALVWFVFRLVSFLIWIPYVHHIFAPEIHKDWIMKDILPTFISTSIFLLILYLMDFSFDLNRLLIFTSLVGLGILLLLVNIFSSSEGRKLIILKFKRISN